MEKTPLGIGRKLCDFRTMQIFRSFKHRNFRLFFVGQALSLLGSWMQGPAVSWLTWRLTESPKWLGVVGFASQIPILITGLLGGVVADRLKRRRLVIIIQTIAMIQAGMLAGLTLSGHISPITILILALFLGFILSFDFPARQTFLMDMVGKEDIGNAVALNSSIVHGARVLGPTAAGIIVSIWGEGTCFVINAISFLFVLASLFMMKEEELHPQVESTENSISKSISSALKIAWRTKEMRTPLLLMGTLSLSSMSYMVLLPQIVDTNFGGGAGSLGIAMSSAGFGALLGAIALASKKDAKDLSKIVLLSLLINGVALIGFSFLPTLVLAAPALVIIGLSGYLVVAATQIAIQNASPPDSRGRLMSIFTVVFFGLVPIGSLLSGFASAKIGPGKTIAICGIICIIVSLYFMFKKEVSVQKTI